MYTSLLNNSKIIIKDLRESRLYHDLINRVEIKEELKNQIQEEEYCKSNSNDVEKKNKKGYHKSDKN